MPRLGSTVRTRSPAPYNTIVMVPICPSGGIGRHRGLKIPRSLRLCRFKSGLGHHRYDHQKSKYCYKLIFLMVYLQNLRSHRQVGKAVDCKSAIHQFESGWLLHFLNRIYLKNYFFNVVLYLLDRILPYNVGRCQSGRMCRS